MKMIPNTMEEYEHVGLVTVVSLILGVTGFIIMMITMTKKTWSVKQLPPLPPDGATFQELIEMFQNKNGVETQQTWFKKHGSIFTIRSPIAFLIPNQVFVAEPHLVKELSIKHANMYRHPSKFTTRVNLMAKATRDTVGVGVTGLTGEEWRWRKDALLKEFRRSRMLHEDRRLMETIVQFGRILCEKLNDHAESQNPAIVDLLTTEAAVGVVLFFLFGRKLDFDADTMRQSAKDLMDVLGFSLGTPGHNILKWIPRTESHRTEQKKLRAQQVVDDVIAPEIKMLIDESSGLRPVHPDRAPGSVIASLIENEPRFKAGGLQSMIAEGRVFVQAGFETTAHSLSFAMGMMAERPDLADEIATQAQKSLNGKSIFDTAAIKVAIEETPLVKNFFSESLRLYPLAPALGGEATEDLVLTTNDGRKYGFPKGTAFYFPNFVLQRDPFHSWGEGYDPDTIDPTRWDVPPPQQPFMNTFNLGAVRICVFDIESFYDRRTSIFHLKASVSFSDIF
jgi:cytochrome P450